MHRRLERQIKKSFVAAKYNKGTFSSIDVLFDNLPDKEELKAQFCDFIDKVNASYKQYERDITLRGDSLRLSSSELIELNQRLNKDSEQQQKLIESICASVNRLLVGIGDDQLDAENLNAEKVTNVLHAIFDQLENAQIELQHQKEALDHHAIVTVCDKRGYLTYANSNFCEISGFSQKELIGLNQKEIKADKDTRHQYDAIWQQINEGKVWHGELAERKKSGEEYWVATTIVPLLNKRGEINKFITIQTDLSPRKKIELDLEKERQFLNSITETMTEGVFALDSQGNCTFFNREAEVISGYKKEEVLGKKLFELFKVKDERGHYLYDENHPLWRNFRFKQSYRSENIRFTGKSNLMFHAALSAVPTTSINGSSDIGVVGVFQNISQRIKAARDLSKAKEVAEQANRQKSEFLANMSHEIRTPLNAIIGLSHITMTNTTDNGQRKQLQKIYRSGNALLEIINEILDFSKIEAGQIQIEKLDFEIEDVIEQLANVESHSAETKQIEFFITKDPNLPSNLIGDPLRITQILMNLTHNAIKFTEHGRVTVNFDFTLEKHDAIELLVNVTDTGIGMTAEQTLTLFQPFYQADASTTRKYGGTGLGLSISQRLAELMDGEISVESTFDVGSVFTLRVPLGISQNEKRNDIQLPLKGKNGLLIHNKDDKTLLKSLHVYGLNVRQLGMDEALSPKSDKDNNFDIVFLVTDDDDVNRITTIKRVLEKFNKNTLIVIDKKLTPKDIEDIGGGSNINLIYPPLNPSKLWDILNSLSSQDTVDIENIANQKNNSNAFSGYTVLLAEDNVINQEVATAMMTALGLNVVVADDGNEAIKKLHENDIDLVFMDIQMPNLDGYSASKEIRMQPAYKNLPIVAITAHALKEDREKSQKAGMNGHITKPIDPEELFSVLKVNLPRKKSLPSENPAISNTRFKVQPINSNEIPENIPGFEIGASIDRIGGNKPLYRKLLGQFVSDFSLSDIYISELINKKDFKAATEELHRFKGAAAALGASKLYEISAQLEEKCKAQTIKEEDITQFSRGLNDTLVMLLDLQLIAPSAPKNSTNTKVQDLNVDKIDKIANDSLRLLEEGNARALMQLDVWQTVLEGTQYQETYALLYEQISSFEFKDAQKTIKDFLSSVHG